MTKVQLLEREVKKLDHASLTAFRRWFRQYDSAVWDRQIERDARAGKLKRLAASALSSHRAGKTKEL